MAFVIVLVALEHYLICKLRDTISSFQLQRLEPYKLKMQRLI